MTKAEHCIFVDCDRDVVSSLGGPLCRGHFISVCYERLVQYEGMHKDHTLTLEDSESTRRFIRECSRDAEEIEHTATDLDNLERAKLIDIIRSANDLGRHLRRSTRKTVSIAVRLCCDRIGGAWEEETETVLLSRYGGSVQCSHPVKSGDILQVIRSDTGQKVQARVTWQRPSGDERTRIGFEFADCDNFWGLDWAAVEETQ
jgi:hypothetical protein